MLQVTPLDWEAHGFDSRYVHLGSSLKCLLSVVVSVRAGLSKRELVWLSLFDKIRRGGGTLMVVVQSATLKCKACTGGGTG